METPEDIYFFDGKIIYTAHQTDLQPPNEFLLCSLAVGLPLK